MRTGTFTWRATVYFQFPQNVHLLLLQAALYEGWNFNSSNYLFATDTK